MQTGDGDLLFFLIITTERAIFPVAFEYKYNETNEKFVDMELIPTGNIDLEREMSKINCTDPIYKPIFREIISMIPSFAAEHPSIFIEPSFGFHVDEDCHEIFYVMTYKGYMPNSRGVLKLCNKKITVELQIGRAHV